MLSLWSNSKCENPAFISVIGTIIGLLSFKEDDKFYTLSKVGLMLCGILAVFMIAVFLMGL